MSNGILNGNRVLDLCTGAPGRYGTMMLADQGAEVIRVDGILSGQTDDGHPAGNLLDRNKKSVVFDLTSDEGSAGLTNLLAGAHAIVSDLPLDMRQELNLAYHTLAELNPRLIYATLPNVATADTQPAIGATLAFGLMAALRQVDATGKGQQLEIAPPTNSDEICALAFSAHPAPPPNTPPTPGRDTDTYLSEMPNVPMTDLEKRALRDAMGTFATGVTVVTTLQSDGTPRGFTANSFTSVSLDPPLLLVCIAKTAHSCDTFCAAPSFAVNVLSEGQKTLSNLFASRDPDKFGQCGWRGGAAGMPLLDEALAGIVCTRERLIDAGDHVILVGRVIDFSARHAAPLGYFKGNYFSIGLEEELVSAASQAGPVKIGALLSRGRQLLLRVGADGEIGIPAADEPRQSLPLLKKHLEKLRIKAQLDFLYAVYQDSSTGHHGIYYHGTAEGYTPSGHKFFDLDDIPLKKLPSAAERSMLTRYCEEFRHGSFGIYLGDETTGTVRRYAAPDDT
ncbi:flavin reductase [Roseovarius pelagicus]|uniref:Flavin reductase n=1 Tax=Roseovarius pelagicus TaxID=2980108 RepID=A0ABY6DFU9_9RHOB|nr:flavin reductase [Roseovarius pelagicus]UXX83833.1 flavin reductase [Roseovarius pelagicus]